MQTHDTIPEGFCQCGCGRKTNIATATMPRHGHVKGQPVRFIRGHGNRRRGPDYVTENRGFDTPCWIASRRIIHGGGYMMICVNGRDRAAHIVYWERENGPVPPGHELHHRCEQKSCMRPDHLEPLTDAEHKHRHTIVSAEEVAEIRTLARTMSRRDIAKQFGISKPYVTAIVSRRCWK